jgi:CHAD domain-containing protein
MRVDEGLAHVMAVSVQRTSGKLLRALRRIAQGSNTPMALFDSRAALRRLRVELTILARTVVEPQKVQEVANELRELDRVLSGPRDAEVMLGDLAVYLRRTPEHRPGLAELSEFLKSRHQRKLVRAEGALASGHLLSERLRDLAHGARPIRDPLHPRPVLLRHFSHQEVWRLYDATLAYDEVLSDTPESEILHHFRNACRALRSGLKIFGGGRTAVKAVTRELHEVQRQLGRYHDHVLVIEQINKWTAQKKLAPSPELREFKRWHRDEANRLRGRYQARWLRLFKPRFRAQLFRALELEPKAVRRTRVHPLPRRSAGPPVAAPISLARAG